MTRTRVFHLANEFSTDTITVIGFLRRMGVKNAEPVSVVDDDVAEAVRERLSLHFKDRDAREAARRAEEELAAANRAEAEERRKEQAREDEQRRRLDAFRSPVPKLYARLLDLVSGLDPSTVPKVLVAYHDLSSSPRYGICELDGGGWAPPNDRAGQLRKVFGALQFLSGDGGENGPQKKRSKLRRRRIGSQWYAFVLSRGVVWHADSLAGLGNPTEYFDARTMRAVPKPAGPPRLAEKARSVSPEKALALKSLLSEGTGRPEEAFLIDESLLRLAVDSLDGAELIVPTPVHVNAMWVFSRPVLMQRPDGTERHVGVLWFQEGGVLWRMRAFTAGGTDEEPSAKQLGEQLVERRPFVPVWDETRPEQKLIAAIWALMSQGGVSENERMEPGWNGIGRPVRADDAGRGVNVVRIKAGTEHASAYGRETGHGSSPHGTFSVRGHWRQQPYPSLGLDEEGHVITKPVWIASYTKGEGDEEPGAKVIVVTA